MTSKTRMAIVLRIACAALLLSLGLGHKPIAAAPFSDPASRYYQLPDGTFADLCITGAGQDNPEQSWIGRGCEVCRLAADVLLPSPSDDHVPAAAAARATAVALSAPRFGEVAARPGSPVRGPPIVLA